LSQSICIRTSKYSKLIYKYSYFDIKYSDLNIKVYESYFKVFAFLSKVIRSEHHSTMIIFISIYILTQSIQV